MDTSEIITPKIATIGTFDGFHSGHRTLLHMLEREARSRGLSPVAITFSNHPLSVLAPDRAPAMLQTPAEKLDAMRSIVPDIRVERFTAETAAMTASEWMRRLKETMGVEAILLGYDNTFGSDGRRMTFGDYAEAGRRLGIEVVRGPELPGHSSSHARRAIAGGDMRRAAHILGRPYALEGTVVEGDRIGRTIGVPTANMRPEPGLALPAHGVYAVMATLPDGTRLPAVTDIGVRPTLDRKQNGLRVETHIPGWSGDLYGKLLRIDFIERLRPEMKFSDIDDLRRQIRHDITAALSILSPL